MPNQTELTVSNIVDRTSDIINLVHKGAFHSGEGIFDVSHYDMYSIYVESVLPESVYLLIHCYDIYETDCERYVKVDIPSYLYEEVYDEKKIADYLKGLDYEFMKNELRSDLFCLAGSIGEYKEFSEEVFKRIKEGQDMGMYEHKQGVVDLFIDKCMKEQMFLYGELYGEDL